ncbi:TolC family protein [Microvirga sp. W0021]|uniref:TolC family protein n=1 Tax=Hohaiivirga grylli TaxID=3133970 RepID=A0ABV0BHQ9_9HYPH
MKRWVRLLGVASTLTIACHSLAAAQETLPADQQKVTTRKAKAKQPKAQRVVSLEEAIRLAADYSWRSKIAAAQVDVAHARVGQAEAGYYPSIKAQIQTPNGRYDHGYNFRGRDFDDLSQAGVELRYNLVDFGRTKYAAAEAISSYRASDWARQGEDLTVLFETAKAYLDAQHFSSAVSAAEAYVSEIQRLNETIREGVAGGIASQSETARGRLALSNAVNKKKALELQRIRATQRLIALVGQDVKPVAAKNAARLPRGHNIDELTEVAQDLNPAVQARDAAVSSARARIEAEKASRMPRLDVVADYKRALQDVPSSINSSRWDGGIRLQLSVDLYDPSRSPKIAEAHANYNVAWAQWHQEQATVMDSIRALKGDYSIASDQWAISNEAQKQASQTRSFYLEEFRLGQRSLSDLITAETEYFTSRVEALSARYDYYQAILSIYYLAGQPREGLEALKLL